MKKVIIHYDPAREFYTPEKCYINELSNSADDPDVSIAQARVKPGVTTQWHQLKGTAERYYILNGKGIVEVEGLPPREVGVGDIVIIPPLCPQRITNHGPDDLVFLAICTPRFLSDVYEDVEDVDKLGTATK